MSDNETDDDLVKDLAVLNNLEDNAKMVQYDALASNHQYLISRFIVEEKTNRFENNLTQVYITKKIVVYFKDDINNQTPSRVYLPAFYCKKEKVDILTKLLNSGVSKKKNLNKIFFFIILIFYRDVCFSQQKQINTTKSALNSLCRSEHPVHPFQQKLSNQTAVSSMMMMMMMITT